jgi:hypothetical protein
VALALITIAGLVSIPVVAAFLDGPSTDDLIVPLAVVIMAALGAGVGYLVPGVGGPGSSTSRSVGSAALVGVAAALLSAALFFLLLSGAG